MAIYEVLAKFAIEGQTARHMTFRLEADSLDDAKTKVMPLLVTAWNETEAGEAELEIVLLGDEFPSHKAAKDAAKQEVDEKLPPAPKEERRPKK